MGFFEEVYKGTPPWDIGRPQKVFVELSDAGKIRGSILDIGCGTGENALYLASRGHEVVGVDIVPSAVERAKAKALERGIRNASFLVQDALDLKPLNRTFDTVIDSGLFHTLLDEERPQFVRSLSSVLAADGVYYILCFSERETRPGGPRRITAAEIRNTFRQGWFVEDIREASMESNIHPGGARGWLASLRKVREAFPGTASRELARGT